VSLTPPCRVVSLALLLALSSGDAAAQRGKPFLRGVALGQYSDLPLKDLNRKLDDLRRLNVTHVSLVVSWSTRDIRSTSIAPDPQIATPDKVVTRIIEAAHRAGFQVFLFPILDVQQRKLQEWRGAIQPPNWDDWWRSYRRFILHYADLAASTKAEMLCVGSELVSTEKMRDRWQNLIGRVRRAYAGKLVYSANWDHYTPVVFWDLVDVIGMTAYYQLAKAKNAPESEMTASWVAIRGKLVAWSRKMKRPFIFTEVGYPSLVGAAVTPWDYTLTTPVNVEEQARAYRAFVRAWSGVPELAGVFFWDWYGDGGAKDRTYTPRGKPAEGVIRTWYAAVARQRPVPKP
jgi:hypothetical protein